ncbi:HEAT repeat domain-containing protein [Segetibacter sp. 3557_3]|uniref:HEAT repeat domain-containing protein n=1 Tax=Segetibacter sp. 3557_3 TaxID=2547429 RepID=UPI001FB69FCD|nr:HEAT repeat domain-containing protein [Segetibacter sp. 3557_3]
MFAENIYQELVNAVRDFNLDPILPWFNNDDTYTRKAAYLAAGKSYKNHPELRTSLLSLLYQQTTATEYQLRQTIVNAAGEIGKVDFEAVASLFDQSLFDKHHSVRNAVIGSIKKMAEVNPVPVLSWASGYLNHSNPEIRREICHGIELRGRKHPADILPMLQQLEFDGSKRVRSTLVHVLGQIAYKKGCLEVVIRNLNSWNNKPLVADAAKEIVSVHHRYQPFAFLKPQDAAAYITAHLK